MVSRAHRTPFGEWWWTVDRLTIGAIGALMLIGVVLSLAASPPVAGRLGLDPFFFVNRHIMYLFPATAIMIGVSFLSPRQIRRMSIVIFAVSLIMVASTPYLGVEIKGAKRWLVIFGLNIQPSEFLKPAFVILVAWLFGESAKRPDMPANAISLAMLLCVVSLLVIQPDFGQTMLIVLVWSALFFMAGMRVIWVFGIAGAAAFGLLTAYFTVPHVARLNPCVELARLLPQPHRTPFDDRHPGLGANPCLSVRRVGFNVDLLHRIVRQPAAATEKLPAVPAVFGVAIEARRALIAPKPDRSRLFPREDH